MTLLNLSPVLYRGEHNTDYELYSKNHLVATFNLDLGTMNVLKPNLMPFYLRGMNISPYRIYEWLSLRVLSISRSNAKVLLSAVNLSQTDRIGICLACHALSLTDCYWIQKVGEGLSWESINLYENSFSRALADVALTGKYVSIQGRICTPELTGMGSYAKCWRRGKDGIYLYKAGSNSRNNIEWQIEVLVSDILDRLDVRHVRYSKAKSGYYDVSRCRNMTTINKSICEMDFFVSYCLHNNIDINKWLMQDDLFFKMLIVDYLIFNTDRHGGNWGVFFSPDTGEVIGLHDLFDHNNSLYLSDNIMSQVISGKTREECAKWAKGYINLDIDEACKYIIRIKKRFFSIFGGMQEYYALLRRCNTYRSW